MTVIKFRAWDSQAKRWITDPIGFTMSVVDGKFHVFGFNDAFADMYQIRVKLQQFTGLKDKNGTEIYEGDVLRLHCGSEDGAFNKAKVKAIVVRDTDRFTVYIPDIKAVPVQGTQKGKPTRVREMHGWVGMHTCLREWQSKLEVIGNIYETPELIKDMNR